MLAWRNSPKKASSTSKSDDASPSSAKKKKRNKKRARPDRSQFEATRKKLKKEVGRAAPKKKKKPEEGDPTPTLAVKPGEEDAEGEGGSFTSKKLFKDLGLRPELCRACADVGFRHPTPIQEQAIPWLLKNRDVVGLAETGSGKTAAFALPVLQHLYDKPQVLHTLVMAPTRELAMQIMEQFEALGSRIGLKACCIIGGTDRTDQAIQLARRPHVVIGTPGRVLDHFENTKGFNMRFLKFLIFDEADRLLNLDFEKEITKLLRIIPKDRRTMLFSATMTNKVRKLQRASLQDPVKVEVSSKYQTVKTLVQEYVFKPAKFKDLYTVYILNELAGKTTMVFSNTIRNCERLAVMLRSLGLKAIPIHGRMNQSARLGALSRFKAGERDILICTDVASRGLDIPSVDVVINYDIPLHSKDYIHRVGRTARAGRTGRAVNIVTQYDVELYLRIEKLIKKKLIEFPTREEEVMILYERVEEATRISNLELKEQEQKRKAKKKDRYGKT